MWVYLLAAFLLLVGIAGSLFGGGIFTIVLIPIAVIIGASAFLYSAWNRASAGAAGGEMEGHPTTNRPLPHSFREDSGHAANSPERLADTRRAQQ